ncbi:MAG: c-type cytochrome [Caulobacteraceae bacterium]
MPRELDPGQRQDRRWTLIGGGAVAGFLIFSVFVAFIVLPLAQAPTAGIDAWTAICRAVGLKPGTAARPQPPSTGVAQPVSQVSWSPKTLDILAQADNRPGATVAAAVCSNCHGENGVSPSGEFPHLAGQSAAAIYKQLSDYRSGARTHPQMTDVARKLNEVQLAQVAAYFAKDNAFGSLGPRIEIADDDIARLVKRGDPVRGIPACNSCHGSGAGGPIETPTLVGQQQEYIARQLRLYKTNGRRNDVYRRMRDIASRLSDKEIDKVSFYFQGLR